MENQSSENMLKWESTYRTRLHELRDQFEVQLPLAQDVKNRAESILRKSILDYRIRCEVSSRIKDFDSFRLKFRSKFRAYQKAYQEALHQNEMRADWIASKITALLNDPFSEITDTIGVRCVGLFTRELYPFNRETSKDDNIRDFSEYFILKEIIANRFDDAGKKGRTPAPSPDEKLSSLSGYRSVHYDLRLKADSIVATLESELLRIPFELQVRNYAQHMIDDVSHFLAYKSDDIFYPAEKFQQEATRLQNILTTIQAEIDKLFDASRKDFEDILHDIQNGTNVERLLDLPITPDTLRLYAIYAFVILRPSGLDLPMRVEEAKFAELWLRELSDGLNSLNYTSIRSIHIPTRKGIEFSVRYYQQQSSIRRQVFKKHDLTDILSKCLLFSITELRDVYPILPVTRDSIEKFLRSEDGAKQ